MHRSVHAIFGYSRQNFQVVKVSSSVGAVSDTGVCVNPEGAWFFSPDRGVYYYNGDGEPKWAFEKVYPLMDNGYFDDANLDEVQVASVRSRIWVRVPMADGDHRCFVFDPTSGAWVRSEEHTSELQSPCGSSYAVFCLKKKSLIILSNIGRAHFLPPVT